MQTDKCEKCLFGCTISFILLFLVVGPFLIFSEYGGLTQPNPVLNADLSISFIVNKTLYTDSDTGNLIPFVNLTESAKL